MAHSLCFSMLIWSASLNLSGFTLHFLLSIVEVLISLAVLSALGMSVWARSKSRLNLIQQNLPLTPARSAIHVLRLAAAKLSSTLSTIRTRTRGEARYWPIVFAAFCCAGMTYGAYRLPKYNVVTEHNVAIIGELPHSDFAYRSDEHPGGNTFRPCQIDMDNGVQTVELLRTAIGYIAVRASWEDRGTCESILRADLGFTFRDQSTDFKFRRLANGKRAEQ